jgi:hypothetical protein
LIATLFLGMHASAAHTQLLLLLMLLLLFS